MGYTFTPPYVDISAVYVLWRQDPTTTLFVHFHTEGMVGPDSKVLYRKEGTMPWKTAIGTRREFPGTRKLIHTVEITGLEPDTTYEIWPAGRGRTYKTFTMPADLSSPVRMVFGGDVYVFELYVKMMNQTAASLDPHCVVIGGDWAYANGNPHNAHKWIKLWNMWMEHGRDSQGRIIPIFGAIGSHEVAGQFGTKEDAPLWYANLGWPEDGYGVLDFGDYLSLVILDTHSNPVEGAQTDWLSGVMAARTNVKYVIPVYKYAAYPSARPMMQNRRPLIRQHWHPLFDSNPRVRVVFEHGDHTYKRTVPIKGGVADPDGIVYCGDGLWGVGMRDVWNPATTWYLDDAKGGKFMQAEDGTPHPDDGKPADPDNARHCYLVTLTDSQMKVDSVNIFGDVFHSFTRPA